jgi:Mg2+-importing ATPase
MRGDNQGNLLESCARSSINECFSLLETGSEGLSFAQVKKIQSVAGTNVLRAQKRKYFLLEFLKNFTNPLVLILLIVSIVNLALGETVNASIVIMMIFLSVVLNFFQEHKASKAAEELKNKVSLTSSVIREGKEIKIPSTDLVPGDILVLNAGDLVSADARIIEAKDFFVNQSALSGESFPVEKNNLPIDTKNSKLSTLCFTNTVFAGTNVVTGWAKAVVSATGVKTQFGDIAKEIEGRETENSFTLGIKHFSYFILRVILVFVFFIFIINGVIKHNFLGSLTFAIAIAVGLTPEFLPMIMTVTMAKGALIMSQKKGIIVKKLTAIPSFGSMNILCTDKTGTITQGKIKLVKYLNFLGEMDDKVLKFAYLNGIFQSGINNPLDEAIKSFKNVDIKNYTKVDEVPFDFERKRVSIVVEVNKKQLIITKGAPESILEVSDRYWKGEKLQKLDEQAKSVLQKQYEDLSRKGYRVLALAIKEVAKPKLSYTKHDEVGLDFVGQVAFLDPIKTNAKEAIDKIESMGIEVKVITGDSELVTKKACDEAGINVKGTMLGHQINSLTDRELAIKARETTIFARFSPAQKNRVIVALKGSQNVVGYMGDGINDAPSLKSADVGISVNNAVDVARETADFILTKKSLIELADGVKEGRKIFGNTMKYVMMGLSSNFGNMFSVLGAVLFLPFLPMLPIQILLNNFLYDVSQLAIPGDNVDEEYLSEPKRWNMHFIRKFMFLFGPISSIFDFATFGLMYYFFNHSPASFQTGWFVESLATQTLVIHIIRTKKLPFIQSSPSRALLISTIAVVIIGWLIPFSPIGHWFGFNILPARILAMIAGLVLSYLVLVEMCKKIFYRSLSSAA